MFLFKREIKKMDETAKTVGGNSDRISVLEQTAITTKQLEDTIDKTIIPIRQDITQFTTTLNKTMDDLRDMKSNQLIETKAQARAEQIIRERS